MTNITTPSSVALMPGLEAAWQDVDSSFDRFCLGSGLIDYSQKMTMAAIQIADMNV